MSTSETPLYWFTVIGGGLLLGIVVGVPLAWILGRVAQRYIPQRAQQARIASGLLLVLAGSLLWYRAQFNFLIDSAIIGLGIGLITDAARRSRLTAP